MLLAACGDNTSQNLAPTLGDITVRVAEDTTAELRLPAADPEGASLTFVVGVPAHGTLTGTAPTLTYTPTPDYHGTDQIAVEVSDGALSTTAVIHIEVTPVNDAPVATDDTRASAEDATQDVLATTLLANDTDADGDPLTVTGVDAAAHGTAVLADGMIHFVPDLDFVGDASFEYVASDGTATDRGRVVIAVGGVNDAPVAVGDAIATDEDTAVDVDTSALVANDTDTEGQALEVTAVGDAIGGTVSLTAGTVRFTPTADQSGAASFTYTISDGAASATGQVAVTVAAVNDAPVAVADAITTDEDTAVDVAASALIANDTDVDGPTATVTAVGDAIGGTVGLSGGTVRFTPAADFNGPASFTYTVSDGAATATGLVAVTVAAVNDAPVAIADALTTDEDTAVDVAATALAANDTDVDGPSATVTAVGAAIGGTVSLTAGTVRFTPAANFNGPASFSYTVSDGTATATGQVAVTVAAVNDAPIAIADALTTDEDTDLVIPAATLLANDTDVDGTATISAVASASAGTVALAAGVVTYHPAADAHGVVTFTYTITDGALTDQSTVTVTIAAVNDAPVAMADTATTSVNTPLTIAATTLLGNDHDPDGDSLTLTAVGDATDGTVALAGGVVTFTPAAGFSGTASFGYTIQDPTGATATATATITITGVCGDGVVAAGEQCDDGNATLGDGCTPACIDEFCGDATVNDAQARPPTALTFTWLATSCGAGAELTITINGVPALVTTGDTGTCNCTPGVRTQVVTDPAVLALITDGANQVHVTMPGGLFAWLVASVTVDGAPQEVVIFDAAPAGDAEARTADVCVAAFASDPDVTTTATFDLVASEQCDDGDDTDPLDGCHACVLARCGDGVAQHTEACDDGNAIGGDGCRADCQGEEICGDQLIDGAAGEQCDDGDDTDPLDGCNACRLPACGDGAQQVGEACDDGNTAYADGCRGDCNGVEVCGDGYIDFAAGEQCDDGDDTDPADGCHACALGVIADVAPQVVSGALSCNTNTSNTGRKIASDGIANFFVVMNCGGAAWTNASTDRGATWGAPVNTGLTGVGEVALEGGGPLGVVYVAAVANGRLVFARSLDAGASWEAAQDLGAANDNEVSIDALGDEVFIAASTGGAIQVYRNPSLGTDGAWASVSVTQSNVFHDVIVDKMSGAVVAASDDPSFHLRISTDGGATFGAESAPAGTAFFSDWTASNGVLYVAGTGGGSDLATVIPLSAPATSTSVSGLPTLNTSQARAIDADPHGNAYVASQLDSGVIQLDRIQVGATAVTAGDVRTFGTGAYPGVAALPSSTGAVLVYGAGGQVWVAVEGY
ncbi:MAG: tandem-95 repeat protein [Myxococcales bacterium]|nr:tandem-95 repeat protein [Myxococcales bacterium]